MYYDNKIWVGTDTDHKPVFLLPQMANRHGLIAGATGTGKTVTLKVMAEGFSDMGVPVFLGDIKGDLSGMIKQGEPNDKISQRLMETGVTEFKHESYPSVFWDVYGEQGHPVRTTISEMGPLLLARMLNLNETQAGVLNILFRVADDEGMLLLDVKDVKAMLAYVGENASKYTINYGNVSKASIGAIQRAIAVLEDQGGDKFFGEPALKITDWMKVSEDDGRGYINILACDKLFLSPLMYSTFLLWMLSELYESLPEQGDSDKPRMVFFFDEAHLLFDDCSKQLMDKIEQVVRLIRSKGVGVYFITQNPTDVPMTVLGQLGNRVQHALRAFTPLDQKAVKVAAQTFRANPAFDTEKAITELQTGEALISFLDEKGAPGVVQRATILPPQSFMGAISDSLRQTFIQTSPFAGVYDQVIDRQSAYEFLVTKMTDAVAPAPIPEATPLRTAPVMSQAAPVQTAAPAQGFMVFDPTTGTYVQKQLDTMAPAAEAPAAAPQAPTLQAAPAASQAAPAPAAPAAAQPQTVIQNVLVLDPTTGQYVQKAMTMQLDPATGQYKPMQTQAELKAAKEAAAAKAQADKEAAKAAKEAETEARRQRTDELREERAERARANNSVLGRIKNTAISTVTRTVTSELTRGLLGTITGKRR